MAVVRACTIVASLGVANITTTAITGRQLAKALFAGSERLLSHDAAGIETTVGFDAQDIDASR